LGPRQFILLALCTVAPSAVFVNDSAAKVIVKESTIHYSVNGRTGKEIYDQFSRKGPKIAGDRTHKVATTTLAFDARNMKGGLKGRRCVVTNVDIHVSITYRIPKWTGSAKASPAVRRAWDAFIGHIWRHEKHHGQIAREYAQELERGIKAIRGEARRDCAGMAEAGARLVRKSRARHDRKQAAFDASWLGDGGKQFKHDRVLYAAK